MAKANGTPVYTRQHKRGLTLPQQSAVDLLVTGKTDTETAEALNLSRTCVTKWRLYDPVFQAALNQRRAEVWGAGLDRLRSLIPKALDALAAELDNPESPHRFKAAAEVLRLAQLPEGALKAGPTDPEEIVRKVVSQRRSQAQGPLDDLLDDGKGLPPFERHMEQTWRELEAHPRCTLIRPEAAREGTPPPFPQGGMHGNGLSNGSARRLRHRRREGDTQALAHTAIPVQVRPTRRQPHHDPPRGGDSGWAGQRLQRGGERGNLRFRSRSLARCPGAGGTTIDLFSPFRAIE